MPYSRFNPRTREGCDVRNLSLTPPQSGFNPRTREGCDSQLIGLSHLHFCFNPRTREGCDYSVNCLISQLVMFQSTHPRGVRHSYFSDKLQDMVSIHAPARGATEALQQRCVHYQFQSTHPRGVRLCNAKLLSFHQQFQSTHPRGVRRFPLRSVIAPLEFQSTHPRGVRRSIDQAKQLIEKFQSTHPRGVRLPLMCLGRSAKCFNPRTREGCDVFDFPYADYPFLVSIHAPARGATPAFCQLPGT